MKISNYLFLLLLILFSACSEDDSTNQNEEPPIPSITQFEFSVNGTPIDGSGFTQAAKNSHHIHLGTDNSGTTFLISFDENGHFGKVVYTYIEPLTNVAKQFSSYRNYSSHYFNFQLISHDAVHKRAKVALDGYIYKDPLDLNSESKFVNGSFDLPYEEYVPTIANLINEATINGAYWRSTNKYQKRDVGGIYHNVTLHTLSDDAYKIMISFNDDYPVGTLPGTYNFSSNDVTNKIQIAKFNVATASYTLYNCTGTMVLTNKWNYCVQGTYNITGVNPSDPNDIITVENGNFKLDYNPNN